MLNDVFRTQTLNTSNSLSVPLSLFSMGVDSMDSVLFGSVGFVARKCLYRMRKSQKYSSEKNSSEASNFFKIRLKMIKVARNNVFLVVVCGSNGKKVISQLV